MIPKIIHYVWVGTAPKSDLVLQCIESWKKYCPDYEIKEWNNDDLAKIDNAYVREAFECKKWAFVSDYLRLYALNKFGGFYFDSDLEITAPIDKFRNHDFVTGYENWKGLYSPITAFMGATKGNKIIKDLLHEYDNLHFLVDGHMDKTTNTNRITKYFENNFGLKSPYDGAKTTTLDNTSVIFPSFYFCTPEQGKENYSIHHFNASWYDGYDRKTKLKFGKYSLVRFKKIFKTETLPLQNNEKIVWRTHKHPKVFYAIIKKVSK